MKKLLYFFLFVPCLCIGQTVTRNYITTSSYTKPSQVSNANPSISQTQITYFDGLGRTQQLIAQKASPDGGNIVTCFEYDGFGRQSKNYLPYATSSVSLDLDSFALMSLNAFYNAPEYENTLNPYSEKRFESSPLGRLAEEASPGADWKIGKNTTRYNYLFNQSTDKIRKFSVTHPSGDTEQTTLAYNGLYPINTLDKTITKDENWGGTNDGYYQVEWDYKDFVNSTSTSGQNIIFQINNNVLTLTIDVGGYPYSFFKTGVVKVLDINISDVNLGNLSYDGIDVYNVYIQNNKLYFTKIYTGNALVAATYNQTLSATVEVYGISKGHTTEVYTDKMGRTILKRTFEHEIPHDTYYVYDKFSNLTYVIPPLASEQIIGNDFLSITPIWRNYPWTKLTSVDPILAVDYESTITSYDNSDILNVDFQSQYGGKGGFSVVTDDENNLMLNLNITTTVPESYNTGIIADLTEFGNFNNQEIGRIDGPDYEYIFLITGNNLEVVGSGKVPSINATFNTGQKLDYAKNYSWSSLCIGDTRVIDKYENDIKLLHNSQILSTYTPNDYGAQGGASVSLDSQDNISVSLNISSQTEIELKSGSLFTLDIQRSLPDMDLGVVQGQGYRYEFSIVNNNLNVKGSGKFNNLTFFGNRGPLYFSSIRSQVVNGLCYIYHYDKKNRVIEKHIPDNGWTHIVYDKLDRPVFTQDSNLREKPYDESNWLFTKYDVFSRIAYTGDFRNELNRKQLQTAIDNVVGGELNESRSSNATSMNGLSLEYTINVFGNINQIDLATFNLLSVNYYDDYQFEGASIPSDVEGTDTNYSPTGLSTAKYVRSLGTDLWAKNIFAYDKEGRTIYTSTDDSFLTFKQITSKVLGFTGNVLKKIVYHSKYGQAAITVVDEYSYDNGLRLLQHTQQVGNEDKQLIAWNKYDELCKLKEKRIGDTNVEYMATAGLQKVDYTYNIRGWLKNMNDVNSLGDDLFSFKMLYNNNGTNSLYNGNISETQWISVNDNILRSYKYNYDDLNRLTNAEPYESNVSVHSKFWEGGIQYDKNGNIKALSRTGFNNDSTFGIIDNLSYIYKPYSNQLLRVNDSSGKMEGFDDNNVGNENDYDYDTNGNIKKDLNKSIGISEQITYNHLNLPVKITIDPVNYIEYTYNAVGIKQQKKVMQGGVIKTTQYADGFIYENNVLQYFSHPEGYVSKNFSGNFSYIYQYKDYLGNIRLSYTKNNGSLEIVEENNYYPFGLKHSGYNDITMSNGNAAAQKIKYNGKELQDELKLNLYYYGARNYDPVLGRWMNIDPLAYRYDNSSPYSYSFNNPVLFTDPDGMTVTIGRNTIDNRPMTIDEIMKLLNSMQNMTNDQLTYDGNSKQIVIKKRGSGEKDKGTDLIRDLIGHKKNMVLDYGVSRKTIDGNKVGMPGATTEEAPGANKKNSSNRVGNDAIVTIGVGHKYLAKDLKTGKYSTEVMTNTNMMNHEFNHALAQMNGESKDPNMTTVHYYTDGKSTKTEKIAIEEAYTVGFEGYTRPESDKTGRYTTENELNKEQGSTKQRVNYGF